MAEIMVERQKSGGPWKWVVLVLVLALVGAAAWYFALGPGRAMIDQGEAPAAQDSNLP